MITVKVRWEPPDVVKQLRAHPEVVAHEMSYMMEEVRAVGVREAVKAAPVDRGTLRQTLYPGEAQTYTMSDATKAIIGSKLIYTGPQEDAQEFTRRKRWWPPHKELREWVYRHRQAFGLTTDKEIESVTFLVRRKIATKGIAPRRFLKAGFDAIMVMLPKAVEDAAERILKSLKLK